MRRLLAVGALLVVAALAGAACSGGDANDSNAASTSSSRRSAATSTTAGGTPASGDLAAVRVKLTEIAELERPTALATRRDDDTLYVTEKVGRVRAVRGGRLAANPALDISEAVGSTGNEQGLLGMAFSPDGFHVYLDFTNRDGDTRLVEYAVDGSTIDATSARQLLSIDQPQPNHNGGGLVFGPDGLLYIGSGDGGGAGDVGPGHASGGNGQSTDTLLGKLLRIDPTPAGGRSYSVPAGNPYATGGGRPEIFAIGLRNPWRFSFDRATGDLWIGDVGQNAWEEVDFVAAGHGAGDNFGWNRLEGTHPFAGEAPRGLTPPLYEYSHADTGGCSITGGYVYRGKAIPALTGVYVFADYCTGQLQGLTQSGGVRTAERALGVEASSISSFGEDGSGELYVLSDAGTLLRVDPA